MVDDCVVGSAIHEGVAGCESEATVAESFVVSDARRSYCETVLSVDAARTLFPDSITATSVNGFAVADFVASA